MKTFFTADLHLYHNNIIKYCNRPFANTESMKQTIIKNWNSVVSEEDEIYILGDIGVWHGPEVEKVLPTIRNELKGKKHLVLGNHDNFNVQECLVVFESVNTRLTKTFQIEDRKQTVVLDHFPMVDWDGKFHGSWQLFGHIHSLNNKSYCSKYLCPAQYDVGVDNNNFTPVSLEDIDIIITNQVLKGNK